MYLLLYVVFCDALLVAVVVVVAVAAAVAVVPISLVIITSSAHSIFPSVDHLSSFVSSCFIHPL